MSYYDVPEGNSDREIGRKIYMDVLSDRRGFRDDQLGIEDQAIWIEIFQELGKAAKSAVKSGMETMAERMARAAYEKFNENLIPELEPFWINLEQSFKERMIKAQEAAIAIFRGV